MKQMKIMMIVALAILMGTTFTSCLGSGGERLYDGEGYGTVTDRILGSRIVLDNNVTLNIINPAILQNEGNLAERVHVQFKLREGDVFVNGKTSYDGVTIVGGSSYTPKYFCDIDTLGNSTGILPGKGQPIQSLRNQYNQLEFWGANGYINIVFGFNIDSKTNLIHLDMYPEDVKDGVLQLKLHQNQKIENVIETKWAFVMFKYLNRGTLQEALKEKYDDLIFYNNDTIKVAVVADNGNDTQIKTDAVKMRVMNVDY